jgi:hypothetical protein
VEKREMPDQKEIARMEDEFREELAKVLKDALTKKDRQARRKANQAAAARNRVAKRRKKRKG